MHGSKYWQIHPYLGAAQINVTSSPQHTWLFIEWQFQSVLFWLQLKVLSEAQTFFQRLWPSSVWGKEQFVPHHSANLAKPLVAKSTEFILVHLNYKYGRPVNMELVSDVFKRVLRCFVGHLFIWGSAGSTLRRVTRTTRCLPPSQGKCSAHYPARVWAETTFHHEIEHRGGEGTSRNDPSKTFWVINDTRQGRNITEADWLPGCGLLDSCHPSHFNRSLFIGSSFCSHRSWPPSYQTRFIPSGEAGSVGQRQNVHRWVSAARTQWNQKNRRCNSEGHAAPQLSAHY